MNDEDNVYFIYCIHILSTQTYDLSTLPGDSQHGQNNTDIWLHSQHRINLHPLSSNSIFTSSRNFGHFF